MTSFTRRWTAAVAGVFAVAALVAVSATAVGAKSKGKAVTGTAYVAVTRIVGSGPSGISYVAGDTTDTVFGAGAVTYALHLLPSSGTINVKASKVTQFTSNGSLTGTGTATLTIGAGGKTTVSKGMLALTKGSGAQKGHTLHATFSGTGSVATGSYKFNYTGTYK